MTLENIIITIQHLIISTVGIIGNTLVILVYRSASKEHHSVRIFIINLAHTDLFCCLFLLPVNCYHELSINNMSSDFICKFHSFLNILNITYSCQIVTLIAFERYLSICRNIKLSIMIIRKIMRISFVCCFILGGLGFFSVGIYHQIFIPSN